MPIIKIPKYDLRQNDLPGAALMDEITDTSRWSIHHRIVFLWTDGKYYTTTYSVGATESQDESPWEYDDDIACIEVEHVDVLRKSWEPVGMSSPIDYQALVTAAREFIAKVESGQARSIASYAALKSALGTGVPA
jgi:hypothetical protein